MSNREWARGCPAAMLTPPGSGGVPANIQRARPTAKAAGLFPVWGFLPPAFYILGAALSCQYTDVIGKRPGAWRPDVLLHPFFSCHHRDGGYTLPIMTISTI